MTVVLLLMSSSLLADRPECSKTPGECAGNPPGLTKDKIAAVPEPGSLALIGLGVAGLVIVRKRKS